MVVGRPTPNGDKCRVITCSGSDLDPKTEIDVVFPIPDPPTQDQVDNSETRIKLSTPSWCHYIQGVVALMNGNFRGSKVNQIVGVPPFEAVIASRVPIGGGVSSSAALEVATCLFIEELCKYKEIKILQKSNEVNELLIIIIIYILLLLLLRRRLCYVRRQNICMQELLVVLWTSLYQ